MQMRSVTQKREDLRALLASRAVTVMPGGFSPLDAATAAEAGFGAFFLAGSQTSGHLYGVPDAGILGLHDMANHAAQVAARCDIPVLVDGDTGYGNAVNVYFAVQEFVRAGVAAVQIEDQESPKKSGTSAGRRCISADEAVGKYQAAVQARDEIDPAFVICARCDAIGAEGEDFEDAVRRCVRYVEEGGVDFVWLNSIQSTEQVKEACERIPAPVMTVWGGDGLGPTADEYEQLGLRIALYPVLASKTALQATWDALHDFRQRGLEALADLADRAEQSPWGKVPLPALNGTEPDTPTGGKVPARRAATRLRIDVRPPGVDLNGTSTRQHIPRKPISYGHHNPPSPNLSTTEVTSLIRGHRATRVSRAPDAVGKCRFNLEERQMKSVVKGRTPSTGPFTTARGLLPLLIVSFFLFAVPILMLVVGAFRNAPPGSPALWSLDAFGRTYTDPESYRTLWNSVILAGSSTLFSTTIAFMLAFLVTRTTTPLRKIVTPSMVLVVALPPLFYAMSWGMLGNPTIGLINTLWRDLTGGDGTLFNANSWLGLITVVSIKGAAFSYLLLLGPFRALDRSLEEAAQVSGAGRMRTILGIDLFILAPAITGVVILNFVIGLEAFDVPLFLGTPADIQVFSTQIYHLISSRSPADYGAASALSLLLVVVVICLVALQWRILGRRRYSTVSGKSYRTEPWDIGAWRWVGAAFIAAHLVVSIVLPLVQLVLGSLQPYFGGGGSYSLTNYERILSNASTMQALQATFTIALVGGIVAMALALLIVYAITHNETRLRRVLDLLTWLPWAVPGVVLSLGLAWTYVSIPGFRQLYGSLFVVGLGLVVAVIPIATRAIQPALIQINRELEEASRVSGARSFRMVMGIIFPLVMPSFLAGWIVVAIVISGNLAIPILLSSSQSPTVPLVVYRLYSQGETSAAAALLVVMLSVLFALLAVVSVISRYLSRRTNRRPVPPVAGPETIADEPQATEDQPALAGTR